MGVRSVSDPAATATGGEMIMTVAADSAAAKTAVHDDELWACDCTRVWW